MADSLRTSKMPTENLRTGAAPRNSAQTAQVLAHMQGEHISVRQERCIQVRNRHAQCLRCAQACTSGCISYDEGSSTISVNQGLCVGCGTCATVCPTCALEARGPNDTELVNLCKQALSAQGSEGTICELKLACSRCADEIDLEGTAAVSVVCLGRVDESLLIELVSCGAERIRLICGNCPACELHKGRETLDQVLDTTATLLKIWGSSASLSVEQLDTESSASPGAAKTDASGANEGSAAESSGLASFEYRRIKVMPDGTLPHFIPDRRERLLDALGAIGEPSHAAGEPCQTRLWGHVSIDPGKCTGCRMCATFCPTGAIRKFDEDNGTFGIDHYPSDCVKCLCCQDICRVGAITVDDDVPADCLVCSKPERHAMRHKGAIKGGVHSILGSMRELLGMPEVFER